MVLPLLILLAILFLAPLPGPPSCGHAGPNVPGPDPSFHPQSAPPGPDTQGPDLLFRDLPGPPGPLFPGPLRTFLSGSGCLCPWSPGHGCVLMYRVLVPVALVSVALLPYPRPTSPLACSTLFLTI